MFWDWIPPGPNLSEIHAKGCGGLQPGASRDCRPPWGDRPKADRSAGSFARRSGKADHAARTSSWRSAKADFAAGTSPRRSAKADRPARTSSRRSAKADHGGRLCPARGFFGRAAGRNGALPYIARKSRFLRNGDVWATESLFLFAVLWLAILLDPSETGIAGGEKPASPNPGRPAAAPPNDCDRLPVFAPPARTPVPATPPQSACSRRLSGCPQRPNLSARRRAESPQKKRKGGTLDETRTTALTTTPPDESWEAPRLNPQDCAEEVCQRQTCKPPVYNLGLPAETRPASRKACKTNTGGLSHETRSPKSPRGRRRRRTRHRGRCRGKSSSTGPIAAAIAAYWMICLR